MKTIEEMKSFPAARKNYRPEKVEKLSEEQMKWFRDAKFGMFIHWGLYSELGGVWKGQPVRAGYSLGSIFDARKRGMGADE